MNKEEQYEMFKNVGLEIFTKIGYLTKDIWRPELGAVINKDIDQHTIDMVVLEGIMFAIYYTKRRHESELLDKQTEKDFDKAIREGVVWGLSELYFESPDKKNNPEKHKKTIEEFYDRIYKEEIAMYSGFEGEIVELYKLLLLKNFNESSHSNIVFIEDTKKNRFRLKLSDILGGVPKRAHQVRLKMDILNKYIEVIVPAIAEIEFKGII